MSRTAADVTPEEMEVYRAAYRKRKAAREAERLALQEQARNVAAHCAATLYEKYGASRVVLYGSLARGSFARRSDIDLAVWGLSQEDFFEARDEMLDAGGEFEVNLAPYEKCKPAFKAAIDREGVLL